VKVALLCDWLTTFGGAEQVLLELHHLFPDAPIYTSQYRPLPEFQHAKIHTARWNFLPARLRNYLTPLRARFFRRLDLTAYDLVISSAMAECKFVKARRHLCYINGIPRYYWSDATTNSHLQNLLIKLTRPILRRSDYDAAQQPTVLIANSRSTQDLIKQRYKRDSTIIFPPVAPLPPAAGPPQLPPFYLAVARQEAWKNLHLTLTACLRLGRPLVLIGDGSQHTHLRQLAADSPLITFVPRASRADIHAYLQSARALIQASDETFGIAAVEALQAGTPVIALQAGGALDYVEDGKNGIFFMRPTVAGIIKAVQLFEAATWPRERIKYSARAYTAAAFRQAIQKLI
jgi:glycosyltransferase involved in cell wall biosynthesis